MHYSVMTANVTPVDCQCPNYPSNHQLQINLCCEAADPQQQHNALPTLSAAGRAGIPVAALPTRRRASRPASARLARLLYRATTEDVFKHGNRISVFKLDRANKLIYC